MAQQTVKIDDDGSYLVLGSKARQQLQGIAGVGWTGKRRSGGEYTQDPFTVQLSDAPIRLLTKPSEAGTSLAIRFGPDAPVILVGSALRPRKPARNGNGSDWS